MSSSTRVVAVWRHRWLAPSETFIVDQIDALERWQAITMGRTQMNGGLRRADVAPFSNSLPDRVRLRLLDGRAGLRHYESAVRASGAMILHAHFATEGNTVGPLAEALRLPLIVSCHGYDVTAHLEGKAQHRRARALSRSFSSAARVVAVSEFIAAQAMAHGAPEDRVVVRPIGIRTQGPPVDEAAPRRGILFVGRLVPKKGVDDLLRAYARLPVQVRERNPLTIAGEGDDRPALEATALALGLEPRFVGWQDPASVRSLMRSTAVFCSPSQTARDGDAEGFGLVFLEAALEGAPSVAYRHGGVPEAVLDGVTGLLVGERDVASLAAALQRVLVEPGLGRSLAARGRARVLRDFDISRCTAALEGVYDELCGA